MMNSDRLMIEKQAAHITRLSDQIKKLQEQIRTLEYNKSAAGYWLDLTKQVQENPMLQGEWDRFCAMLKLVGDEEFLTRNYAYS